VNVDEGGVWILTLGAETRGWGVGGGTLRRLQSAAKGSGVLDDDEDKDWEEDDDQQEASVCDSRAQSSI
jgi:hypothetical protein